MSKRDPDALMHMLEQTLTFMQARWRKQMAELTATFSPMPEALFTTSALIDLLITTRETWRIDSSVEQAYKLLLEWTDARAHHASSIKPSGRASALAARWQGEEDARHYMAGMFSRWLNADLGDPPLLENA